MGRGIYTESVLAICTTINRREKFSLRTKKDTRETKKIEKKNSRRRYLRSAS